MRTTHRRRLGMIRKQTINQAQLPLPFHPRVTANLSDNERIQLRQMLAQLLLSAAGISLEAENNDQ
jgi:hypothetical protein